MRQSGTYRFLEERLRREAAGARDSASPELTARIVAALEGQERAPRRSYLGRRQVAAAALLLVLGVLWSSGDRRGSGELQVADAAPGSLGVPADARGLDAGAPAGGALSPRVAAAAPAASTARGRRPVFQQVRGWARSSSIMLRANVDEPLERELKALSLDFLRVVDTVVVGLPEVLARPFESFF